MKKKQPKKPGGLGEMLSGDRTKVADIKLLRRAVREGWNVPQEALQEAGPILLEIARQATTETLDADGKVVEISNARNQIAAVKALTELDKINQTDHWNEDKNRRLDEGKVTDRVDGVVLKVVGAEAKD
jgi:hypothetical protein